MRYIETKWKYIIYTTSIAIIFFSIILAFIIGHYRIDPRYVVPTGSTAWIADDILGTGALLALTPVAYISYRNHLFLKSVEKNIPRFLRDILQSTDSGLILPKALIEASRRNYGPISEEIGVAMSKFTLGYDFRSSILEATKRLRHPFAPQVGMILVEAYAAGGKTHDVLNSSVMLFNGLEQYGEEKQSELKPYIQLVYLSVIIFLVIALMIISQFVVPFENVASSASAASKVTASAPNFARLSASKIPSLSYFQSVFFLAAILESISAGIVAGKIVDGSAASGLRHSLIMIAITLAIFNLPGYGIFA